MHQIGKIWLKSWKFRKEKKIEIEKERNSDQLKRDFLNSHATRILRVSERPELLFFETEREMNGKYGWFSCYGKRYNMTVYYSGWLFNSIEKFNEFNNI